MEAARLALGTEELVYRSSSGARPASGDGSATGLPARSKGSGTRGSGTSRRWRPCGRCGASISAASASNLSPLGDVASAATTRWATDPAALDGPGIGRPSHCGPGPPRSRRAAGRWDKNPCGESGRRDCSWRGTVRACGARSIRTDRIRFWTREDAALRGVWCSRAGGSQRFGTGLGEWTCSPLPPRLRPRMACGRYSRSWRGWNRRRTRGAGDCRPVSGALGERTDRHDALAGGPKP